ncbi:MAG: dependent oxidoreductase, partial [Herbinix sp.]|nr:dependent oxidoreductase [Herbinix sp.]
GSESQTDTKEPHALEGAADPYDMQSASHCFAVDYIEGADFTIDKPETYDYWKKYKVDYWPDMQLSMTTPHHITHEPLKWSLFGDAGGRDMFQYRRILDKSLFQPGSYQSDITIINVPQTDYFEGNIFEVPDALWHLKAAKQLSLSFLYWLQTEAPTAKGTPGYRGLRLRKDVMGTEDGLAKAIYVRESRRIKAEFTILEQHVATDCRKTEKAVQFDDSVGIGLYRIDLHPSTGRRNYIDIGCLPFQIPLGAFIPIRLENMLPACKNIGTTHITNGCYRLHPVEWNIGEAAGALAAYCITKKYNPREVYHTTAKRADFQTDLKKLGIQLEWSL